MWYHKVDESNDVEAEGWDQVIIKKLKKSKAYPKDLKGLKVLDIGCAIGTELLAAHERGWNGTGVELSYSSVRIAKEKELKIHIYKLEDWLC